MAKLSSEEIHAWGESFEAKQPQEVLAAAIERYAPKIVLACSFGAEDVVLVDMVHRIDPSVPLFYLDTDFLFPETYATRDRMIEQYGLKPQQVIQVKSLLTPEQQAAQTWRGAVGRRSGSMLRAAESGAAHSRAQGIRRLDHRHQAGSVAHESQCETDRVGCRNFSWSK